MKKFTVNVHYDAIATVTVLAETEEEALERAEHEAEALDSDDFDFNSVTGS